MDQKKIEKIITELEVGIASLRNEIGDSAGGPRTPKAVPRKSTNRRGAGSTEPVKELIARGFFDQAKTVLEVVSALKKKALHFKTKDVAVTLMRFVRTIPNLLEREGEGTKVSPWKYKKV